MKQGRGCNKRLLNYTDFYIFSTFLSKIIVSSGHRVKESVEKSIFGFSQRRRFHWDDSDEAKIISNMIAALHIDSAE